MTITWKEGNNSMTANQIAYWSLAENKDYHGKVTAENARHNKASERLQGEMNAETSRHNRETESISWANYAEVVRHNVAMESNQRDVLSETARHNRRLEETQEKYNINWASLQQQQVDETNRHNLAVEEIQRASENRQQQYSEWSMHHQDLQLLETTISDALSVGNQWFNSYLTGKRDKQTARRDSQNFWSHIIGSATDAAASVFGSIARAGLLS